MEQYEDLFQRLQDLVASGATDTKSLEKAFKEHKTKRSPAQLKAFAKRNGIVTPEKGFVVKTVDSKEKKVFINVCSHNNVPAPADWLEWMSEQRDSRDASVDGLRVPLSVGIVREDSDRGGAVCSTVDCIVNTSVLKVAQIKRNLKSHLIRSVVNCVGREQKLQLDPHWKLPKLTAKGEPKPQVLDVVNLPVVQEMDSPSHWPSLPKLEDPDDSKMWDPLGKNTSKLRSNTHTSASTEVPKSSRPLPTSTSGTLMKNAVNQLKYSLKNIGKPVAQMEVVLTKPNASLTEETEITVTGFDLTVQAPSCDKLVVQLPFGAEGNQSTATLETDGSLKVVLPIKLVKDWWL